MDLHRKYFAAMINDDTRQCLDQYRLVDRMNSTFRDKVASKAINYY